MAKRDDRSGVEQAAGPSLETGVSVEGCAMVRTVVADAAHGPGITTEAGAGNAGPGS